MNPLNKLIGLIASTVIVVGVAGTTLYQENNSATPIVAPGPSSQNNSNTSQTTTATVPVATTPAPVKTTPKTTTTTKITYVKKCTTSPSGDDDDSAGITTCVNVPVTTTVNTPVSTPAPVSNTTVATPPPATIPKQTASVYKNGTYTATGTYGSPAGYESISVTVTLANDIITSASVTPLARDRTSLRYQNYFISGYQSYVIGQNIANVNLTYVSGSSLTPAGFNSALSQIMTQAKA